MDGRRQAPKQTVLEIRRRGTWGDVKYEHILECGHTEVFPRASKAKRVACMWCVKLADTEETTPATGTPLRFVGLEETYDNDEASAEIELSRVRANLASIINVPVDAIEIVTAEKFGMLEIRAAYIFLSAGDLKRILTKGELGDKSTD